MKKFAVIPTHNRPDDFKDAVEAIRPQVDSVIVIAHNCDYPYEDESLTVLPYTDVIPNISKMWNLGLRQANELADNQPYLVAVLNDDAVVPISWFEQCEQAIESNNAAGASGPRGDKWPNAMAGYAFALNGSSNVYADETLQWWYGDDDIQRQCDALGGFVILPNLFIEHRYPDRSIRGVLKRIVRADARRYKEKWDDA